MLKKLKSLKNHPASQDALKQLKPTKSFWGIFSVILFFILPEIVAFVWGGDITSYCQTQLLQDISLEDEYYYKGIEMLFGEGSWLNLFLGFGLLIWLFF